MPQSERRTASTEPMRGGGPSSDTTLIRILADNAQRYPDAVAFREKDRGIWKETSWAAFYGETLRAAAGLEALGFQKEDALLILGDNRVRLYAAMLAAGTLGGYAMPAYPDATIEELRHFVDEARIRAVAAEDQEHVDKALELVAAGYDIEHIVYDDPRGMGHYSFHGLKSWQDLRRMGEERLAAEPSLEADLLARCGPDGPAVFMHSSGTTGKPKGIVLSQRNLLAGVRNAYQGGAFDEGEEVLAYLPMAWVGDFAVTIAAGLACRFAINIPEQQETMLRDMREVAPTFYLAAPRSWDNLLTAIQVRMEGSTPLKRVLYRFFMGRAVAAENRALKGGGPGRWEWLWRSVGETLIFGPIKDQFGFSRLKNALTGGEAIGEDTFVFYRALGIKLRQLYGQTETSAFNAIQRPDEVQLHTVGRPLPGVEVRIAEDGEIMLRGESVFAGYFHDPAASAKALEDGWLHSGDAGYLEEDGHLVVLGRLSEVVHTAAGERFVPNYIENRIKFSPYVRDAAVVGAGRDRLATMLCIDFDAVGHWAEMNGVPYVSYADLSQRPEVLDLLAGAIARTNEALPDGLKVRRFVSLHKEFDADDGEITRTRKLRRNVVEQRYAPVIDALYSDRTDVEVEAPITYEDGTTGVIRRTLRLREV
ncbi:MAG: AMP-binding protein [Alphaproteobacteria bacterium]|nr:AMP-binding protein [Alphaproteobacteria bacterium]MDX5369801.1 AMP-binding protein [Alphaproteobacteria bacterium]MDX5464425.1 AMP-binding protein [Alphaproteobacteria bacterium]